MLFLPYKIKDNTTRFLSEGIDGLLFLPYKIKDNTTGQP